MGYSQDNSEYYTVREAAQKSGLSRKTWYEGGGDTSKVPRIRYGRTIRLLRKDVDEFIREKISEAEQAARRCSQLTSGTALGSGITTAE